MLVIETGAGIANAETYLSVADARSRAALFGATLPATDADVEVLLRKAAQYIGNAESNLKGVRSTETQALAFPRDGVVVHGLTIAADDLPKVLLDATVQLAVDFQTTAPYAVGDGREVLAEAVGPISTTYAKSGAGVVLPVFSLANKLLAPLLRSAGATLFTRV